MGSFSFLLSSYELKTVKTQVDCDISMCELKTVKTQVVCDISMWSAYLLFLKSCVAACL